MMADKLETYVALLRGINVGGRTMVRMSDLRACFEELGYSSVQTYINSGNVIFTCRTSDPRHLETNIEQGLHDTFSLVIRVIVRSLPEMAALLQALPSTWRSATDQKRNVIFLHHSIDTPALRDSLQPKPAIEELFYHPGVLFWAASTSNLAKSKIVKLSRSALYQAMTVRTLATTKEIYARMQATAVQA